MREANSMSEANIVKHDVFISYSTKNKNVADAVVADFEQNGIKCWYAPRDILPGEEWVKAVTNALESSKTLVLIYTGESNNSEQVKNEIAVAFNCGITIVPFRLTEEQMSSELEYYLTRVHWLDALSKPLKKNIVALREYIEVIINTPNGAAPGANREEVERVRERNSEKEKAKKKTTVLFIGIACAVSILLIASALVCVLMLRRKNTNLKNGEEFFEQGSYEEAEVWYEKAAMQGDKEAFKALGDMYYDGLGVEMNEDEALTYYLKACGFTEEGGQYSLSDDGIRDKDMLNRIGLIYFYNYEYEKAAFFFTEDAYVNGDVNAMANAAMAYENLFDWNNAYIWYVKAIDAGHPDREKYEKRIQTMINDGLVEE